MICVFHIVKKDMVAPEWIIAALPDRNNDAERKISRPATGVCNDNWEGLMRGNTREK